MKTIIGLIIVALILGNAATSLGAEPRRPGHHKSYRHTYVNWTANVGSPAAGAR
jgi:hypothetical protein